MKLLRFGDLGAEKPGILGDNGQILDVSAFVQEYDEKFFANDGVASLASWLADNAASCPVVDPATRLGSCVARPSKIICIGLNYAKHAAESGMETPTSPVVFFKASTAFAGPNDPVVLPPNSEKTDWEVELAVVIGKKASYVSEADAMDYVAGYAVHNDISERAYQLEHGGQWVKGKSCDTFAPFGPYMVTKDEVADPHNLNLWLELNGERVQDGNTDDLVFGIPYLVHYLSQYMTLLPGDVISTGTPSGVGLGFNPPRYLKVGDKVKLGIEGMGVAEQEIIAYTPA